MVIGCLGTYLEHSGIQHLLVERKVYGLAVVNSVISGGNYIRGKKGISVIVETMEHLLISSLLSPLVKQSILHYSRTSASLSI